jgi:hypothetical protein
MTWVFASILTLAAVSGEIVWAEAQKAECIPVKPWATLDEPVRLCAYLSDDAAAEACEARGFRLGEGVDETEALTALQSLLLCQHEFVIGVEQERGDPEEDRRLAVTTAILREEDLSSGYYDHGMVRILVGRQGIWEEESVSRWSE